MRTSGSTTRRAQSKVVAGVGNRQEVPLCPCRTGTFAYRHAQTTAISRGIQASCLRRRGHAPARSPPVAAPGTPLYGMSDDTKESHCCRLRLLVRGQPNRVR
jgi:hypothetical protein